MNRAKKTEHNIERNFSGDTTAFKSLWGSDLADRHCHDVISAQNTELDTFDLADFCRWIFKGHCLALEIVPEDSNNGVMNLQVWESNRSPHESLWGHAQRQLMICVQRKLLKPRCEFTKNERNDPLFNSSFPRRIDQGTQGNPLSDNDSSIGRCESFDQGLKS